MEKQNHAYVRIDANLIVIESTVPNTCRKKPLLYRVDLAFAIDKRIRDEAIVSTTIEL